MSNAPRDYKLPPQNLEAERSVLGCILLDKESMIKITDRVTSEDFYDERNGLIFESMLDLMGAHQPIDILSVTNRLKDKDLLERVGGASYVAQLSDAVPASSHIVAYADIVSKKATLRRLLRAASDISSLGYQEDAEIDSLLDQSEQKLFAISQKHLRNNFVPIKSVLTEAFDRIDELHRGDGAMRGIPTGFNDLDGLLAGLHPSDLVILAARPSVGKTSLALDIARNVAVNHKITVGLFSLEMSKEQLVDRMISAEAGVGLWKMRTGRLGTSPNDEDFPRIGRAMALLADAPIYIDDTANLNIMELRTKARRLQMEHGLGLIIIDYLQLMEGRGNGGGSDNRVQEVSEISRALKQVGRELKVPVVALSQLSRLVEQRSPAIPRLADLRESGSIEQDADVVMFIYRKYTDKSQTCTEDEKNIAELHIAKHRNGPTGIVPLYFNHEKVSFGNLDKKLHDPFGVN